MRMGVNDEDGDGDGGKKCQLWVQKNKLEVKSTRMGIAIPCDILNVLGKDHSQKRPDCTTTSTISPTTSATPYITNTIPATINEPSSTSNEPTIGYIPPPITTLPSTMTSLPPTTTNLIKCYDSEICNIGYKGIIPDNQMKWWACGEKCEGGRNFTDGTCNCACISEKECSGYTSTVPTTYINPNNSSKTTTSSINFIKDLSIESIIKRFRSEITNEFRKGNWEKVLKLSNELKKMEHSGDKYITNKKK